MYSNIILLVQTLERETYPLLSQISYWSKGSASGEEGSNFVRRFYRTNNWNCDTSGENGISEQWYPICFRDITANYFPLFTLENNATERSFIHSSIQNLFTKWNLQEWNYTGAKVKDIVHEVSSIASAKYKLQKRLVWRIPSRTLSLESKWSER